MRAADLALVTLAAARLTRLFTEDHLGRWYFQRPVEAWGDRWETGAITQAGVAIDNGTQFRGEDPETLVAMIDEYDADYPWTWQKRLSEGASCRWCVGFWLGGLVLLTGVICTALGPIPRGLWRFAMGALALNLASNAVGRWTGTLS